VIELTSDESVTRAVLDRRLSLSIRDSRRRPTGWMQVTGARENNLRGLDVRIPLGVQVGVCGVSGSGKSSLVVDTIALALSRADANVPDAELARAPPAPHDSISGPPARPIVADQSRAAVPSPGMFLGLVDAIRK